MATVDGRVKGNLVVGRGLRRAGFVVRYGLAVSFRTWSPRTLAWALAYVGTNPKSCTCLIGQIPVGPYCRAFRGKVAFVRFWIIPRRRGHNYEFPEAWHQVPSVFGCPVKNWSHGTPQAQIARPTKRKQLWPLCLDGTNRCGIPQYFGPTSRIYSELCS